MRSPAELIELLVLLEPLAAEQRGGVRVVQAPGRVNLIGEHTDYNGGFVLPAAIDLGIAIALVPTDDRRAELTRLDTGERASVDLDAIEPASGRWIDYVAGMAWAMHSAGLATTGFRGVIGSDMPAGAGLASSAALELASAWALSGGERPPVDSMSLARLAQRAENEHVGVACGLMDQFAAAFGLARHALLLDCRSLDHRAVPLPAATRLVICDSGALRRLAGSAYNARRAECQRAVDTLRGIDRDVRDLRDVTPDLLEAGRPRLDEVAYRRARHVVTENARVLAAVDAISTGDLAAVGEAFAASHRSLRDDFEVSSAALDALVDIAATVPGVIGARLTGAGFGGCTVNLVREDAVEALRLAIETGYPSRTGLTPRVLEVVAADGARRWLTSDRPPGATIEGVSPSAPGSEQPLARDPHRRHDPLRDEWVLVSPGRAERPWLGAEEPDGAIELVAYDPACSLCPGNTRANGDGNPAYDTTFVFANDFGALRADSTTVSFSDGLLRAEGERGECRVVCFSPRHDLSLGAMADDDIRRVVELWADQTDELGKRYRWVQVFENRGAAMGASNMHPHGQIWAGSALPVIGAKEAATQAEHHGRTGRRLLVDYVAQESGGERVIDETEHWLAVVPFWAAWPFELLLVAKRPVPTLPALTAPERDDLARLLGRVLGNCDALFGRPFPYSMGWHQAPFGSADADVAAAWQLHAHVYPPLLRASVRKFLVGYELLAETQRDFTPEEAAERLRSIRVANAVAPAPPASAGEGSPG